MAQGASIRPAANVVLGSGLGQNGLPQNFVTSGIRVDHNSVSTSWQVNWNLNGTGTDVGTGSQAGPNNAPALPYPSMSMNVPGIVSPLIGGTPVGSIIVEQSDDNKYYLPVIPMVVSGFSTASGVAILNVLQPFADWQRLRVNLTSGSGIFDVYFAGRG